jgi:hypothetical protein
MTFAEKTLADAITKLNAEYADMAQTSFSRKTLAENRVQRAWSYAKTWANLAYPTISEREMWAMLHACVPAINTRFH